jgi:hypothetical protein
VPKEKEEAVIIKMRGMYIFGESVVGEGIRETKYIHKKMKMNSSLYR